MTLPEVNTVYKATTTSNNNGAGDRSWSRRFLLFSALVLVLIGCVIIVVSTFVYTKDEPSDDSSDDPASTSPSSSSSEPDDGIEWTVFATGFLLLAAGLIILTLYFVCTHRPRRSLMTPRKGQLNILPKAKKSSSNSRGVGESLIMEPDSTVTPLTPAGATTNTMTTAAITSEEKAQLMNFELRNENTNGLNNKDDIPAHLLHYKPRNFNQHGYGTKSAPIATMDEFDHSLRSSMNSLWSQHVHQQGLGRGWDDDEDEEYDLDAVSFQSAVLH